MRLVPIECVKEGSFLAKTIYDNDGRVLLREGVMLNSVLTRRIRLLQISSIYINDEYSEAEIEDIIKPELKQKAIKTIKDTFYSLEKYNSHFSSSNVTAAKTNTVLKQRDMYFKSIGDVANEILDELLSKKNVLINIVDIKSMDNYTYQHSVNVAVLSLILGMQIQLDRTKLFELCMGALVHDIGKVLVPKEIIQKGGPLTDQEYTLVKTHTLRGYDYLKGSIDITGTSRIVALQHHERVDGNGYPDKRNSENITLLSKIVAIADVYDALTSDRPYRRAMSPNEAIEYIMGCGGRQFDYLLVKAFAAVVIPYPDGTLVRLSNGDIAVIEETLLNFPLRPKVRIIKSSNAATVNTTMDLMEKLHIVIEKVVHTV